MDNLKPEGAFSKWIQEYGPAKLSKELNVDRTLAYKWKDGVCLPGLEKCVRILAMAPHLTLSNLMHIDIQEQK